MNYLEQTNDQAWYINGHTEEGKLLEKKTKILEFMYELSNVNKSKIIHWYTPGQIKHICEYYLSSRDGSRPYVERASCVAAAIMLGVPVKLSKKPENNLIGLYLTSSQFSNLYRNVLNYKATDLVLATKDNYVSNR